MIRIGVATGGAAHSALAVRLAGMLAREISGELHILTVTRQGTDRRRAEKILAQALTQVDCPAERIKTKVLVGRPAQQIVREAKSSNFDLIVLGERAEHSLLRRLLGPTTERVLSAAACPVLLARHIPQQLDSVLLCEGGRLPSLLDRLLTQLKPLLAIVQQVTVLHVMSQIAAAPGVEGWELHANAEDLIDRQTREGEWLAHDAERLQSMNLAWQMRVRHGLVIDEILEEIKQGNYDLVVIGKHQKEGWERFLLDDIAQKIIEGCNQSILIV